MRQLQVNSPGQCQVPCTLQSYPRIIRHTRQRSKGRMRRCRAFSFSFVNANIRSPSLYEPGAYGSPMSSAQTLPSQSPVPPIYSPQLSQTSDPPRTIPRSMSTVSSGSTGRQHNPKTKPQCWEHGCNGREFSTFSNLLRHQREKGGTATKASCPRCGAEFTRTTARNGHMAHDKCTRQPRPSESH